MKEGRNEGRNILSATRVSCFYVCCSVRELKITCYSSKLRSTNKQTTPRTNGPPRPTPGTTLVSACHEVHASQKAFSFDFANKTNIMSTLKTFILQCLSRKEQYIWVRKKLLKSFHFLKCFQAIMRNSWSIFYFSSSNNSFLWRIYYLTW